MTPGEISPGAQKSSQIFDSCPGSGRKMAFLEFSGWNFLEEQVMASEGGDHALACVLDWIRAGLPEDIGHKEGGYGWSRGMAWRGDRRQWCKEELELVMMGTSSGLGEAVVEDLDFEKERVAVDENGWRHLKEGQKLGGGAHQVRSVWSEAIGATDL
ncbi:hypothetical protein BY996DRAFT_6411027 [Phakopsora pachyrhizi]|nr:hypothetical protein BY996DRAFT_6411027 [Phakopsora pachyrhizi]